MTLSSVFAAFCLCWMQSDEWQPEQVNFACAKLQDFAIQF